MKYGLVKVETNGNQWKPIETILTLSSETQAILLEQQGQTLIAWYLGGHC